MVRISGGGNPAATSWAGIVGNSPVLRPLPFESSSRVGESCRAPHSSIKPSVFRGFGRTQDSWDGGSLKLRNLGPVDYVVPARRALGEALGVPFQILVFVVVTLATIVLGILFLAVVFAPEFFFPARPDF